MKPSREGSDTILEFEFHLYIQVYSYNNVCSKWRMNIQTEQNKPHRKWTSIAQEFTLSLTINKIWCYNSLHRKRIRMHDMQF